MTILRRFLWLSLMMLCTGAYAAEAPTTATWVKASELNVPDAIGVNIHFTDPKPGEMEMLAAGGFKWVRMDFGWNGTERERGKYDFGAYERLLAALKPHGIRAMFILDYSNKLYDNGESPRSPEGRAAFAKWAAAAATHFKGQGVLWEMYNEPNIKFWKPKPNVQDYIALALEVGKALRAAAPAEQYIGPATSRLDFDFIEPCFKAGLLEYWSAVSVHPYRQTAPETAEPEYAKLRGMIERYAPAGKKIPIVSGEWGYSVKYPGTKTEETQGKYLPREFLTNLMCGVPLSIWYDWHDDGADPKEVEHHFGTVLYPYNKGRDPVYDPKPAYEAVRTLTKNLAGFRFSKRLEAGGPEDYALLFLKGKVRRIAAWTTAAQPRTVTLPSNLKGRWRVIGHTGQRQEPIEGGEDGLKVKLTDAPVYLLYSPAPKQ